MIFVRCLYNIVSFEEIGGRLFSKPNAVACGSLIQHVPSALCACFSSSLSVCACVLSPFLYTPERLFSEKDDEWMRDTDCEGKACFTAYFQSHQTIRIGRNSLRRSERSTRPAQIVVQPIVRGGKGVDDVCFLAQG